MAFGFDNLPKILWVIQKMFRIASALFQSFFAVDRGVTLHKNKVSQ